MSAEVEAIRELLDRTELESIGFHKLHAERNDDAFDGADDEARPEWGLGVQQRIGEPAALRFLLDLSVRVKGGLVSATCAAEYRVDGDLPDHGVVLGFANKVAIMTMVPYVRQAVADLSARVLGDPVLMPMHRQGDLTFGETDRSGIQQGPSGISPDPEPSA